MKSATNYTFAQLPQADIPRSSFKRNSTFKTTFDAGYLNVCFCDEVLPGDSWNLKMTAFARLFSPLKTSIMDNLTADFQFFFVPIRLCYDDYEAFFGASAGFDSSTNKRDWSYDDSHLMPTITAPTGGFTIGGLADQLGLPTGIAGIEVNALPFRAYNRIVSDWYLPSSYDGLVQPVLKTDNTSDSITDYPLVKRCKRCDYFTSALPQPQRGNSVNLPLGNTAPVFGNGYSLGLTDGSALAGLHQSNSTYQQLVASTVDYGKTVGSSMGNGVLSTDVAGVVQKSQTNGDYYKSGLVADLSSATAASINDIREAFQIQKWLEKCERGGVAYREVLKAHFGVTSPDARLQKSEYLGGGSLPIIIHTVANTNGATGSNLGSLGAYGTTGGTPVGFVKSFVEHGFIIGLMSVRADLTYQQGIPRMFSRKARFDYYWPSFAHLGEQVIKNKEIYADGSSEDDGVFGYQERFAEYRYGVNKITGKFRSSASGTLDSWHLAQNFTSRPTLSDTFLRENVPMSRVEAVTSEPDFLFDSLFEVNCVRPMPLYSTPGLVDHF